MLVGYARVSTVDQETRLQRDALKRAGVGLVFEEKASAVSKRPELERCLLSLCPGDALVVWKLDRLARSLRDLLNILERLHAAGAGIRSLTEPIDTATPAGMLMVQVLGAVAQFERSIIRERSMAGQRAAMLRGKHCGRPRSSSVEVDRSVLRLWDSGVYTLRTLSLVFDLHESTIKRIVYRVHRPCSSSLL